MLPFLKVGAEYELINRYKFDADLNANTWSIRHRGNFFLTGTLKTGDWQFGLKETLRPEGHRLARREPDDGRRGLQVVVLRTFQDDERCPEIAPDTFFIWVCDAAYSPRPFFTASLSWS